MIVNCDCARHRCQAHARQLLLFMLHQNINDQADQALMVPLLFWRHVSQVHMRDYWCHTFLCIMMGFSITVTGGRMQYN